MALFVRNGGSRHTGQAAPPQRNIQQVYKKTDEFRVQAPKSVLDVVEIKSIDEHGIFEVGRGGVFTKTYKISDLNYETASIDEKIAILEN